MKRQIRTRGNSTGTLWQQVQVADIADPTSELTGLSGREEAGLLIAYTSVSLGPNKATVYQWDTSVGSNDPPYIVDGNGGKWIAVAGEYKLFTPTIKDNNGKTIVLQQIASADQAAPTLGNANGAIGGLTISNPPTQAEVQALRNACETLADDLRAMNTQLQAYKYVLDTAGLSKGSA